MSPRSGPSSRQRKPPPPLDPASLDAVALRYLERFQTSRARLIRLLHDKLRQRGWDDAHPRPDVEAVADRFVALGYVDDAAFAEARVRGLARRGMGAGRLRATLSAHGIDADTQASALQGVEPVAAAIAFARRKRLGPFGPPPADRRAEERQLAAMARAGHPHMLARAIIHARSEEELPEPDAE